MAFASCNRNGDAVRSLPLAPAAGTVPVHGSPGSVTGSLGTLSSDVLAAGTRSATEGGCTVGAPAEAGVSPLSSHSEALPVATLPCCVGTGLGLPSLSYKPSMITLQSSMALVNFSTAGSGVPSQAYLSASSLSSSSSSRRRRNSACFIISRWMLAASRPFTNTSSSYFSWVPPGRL